MNDDDTLLPSYFHPGRLLHCIMCITNAAGFMSPHKTYLFNLFPCSCSSWFGMSWCHLRYCHTLHQWSIIFVHHYLHNSISPCCVLGVHRNWQYDVSSMILAPRRIPLASNMATFINHTLSLQPHIIWIFSHRGSLFYYQNHINFLWLE